MCVLVYVHIGAWHRKDVDVSSATDTNLKWDYMGYSELFMKVMC